MPVCLVTFQGEGLSETQLRDLAQFQVRNQISSVPGASVPQPFGGKYRQIMVYVDPAKLEAHQLSPMDVVRAVNDSNLIVPAGDVRIGPIDYSLYSNSQVDLIPEINFLPLKSVLNAFVRVGDVGHAEDSQQIQLNVVRVDGQPSVYAPVLKQGGDTNTIAVVDGVKDVVARLTDVPEQLKPQVVFDQSIFVKKAIANLIHEGGLGLFLTSALILLFLGTFRATSAVLLSIPLSALATFLLLYYRGESINSMVLGGLALAFSRLIDNSVIVLENIHRHLEMGEGMVEASERGGSEVALPVLAATLTTAVVFFPVTLLFGVSRFLFTSMAITVVVSLFASYFVALTVVPLYCSRFLEVHVHTHGHADRRKSMAVRFQKWFDSQFEKMQGGYVRLARLAVYSPWKVMISCLVLFGLSLLLYPALQVAFFPRTDSGQFVVNVKAASGTRLELTEREVAHFEELIRSVIPPSELGIIVSNIGVTPDFSALYTSNSAQHTGFVLVNLTEGHRVGTFEYMDRIRRKVSVEMPQLRTYFQPGGLVDSVLNLGLPAPIDIQVSGADMLGNHRYAGDLAARIAKLQGVQDLYIPQDMDYPALRLNVDRLHASGMGLSQREVIQNVITALTSNQMIAPSYWVDPKSGNDYMLTVQYPEGTIKSLSDLRNIPLHSSTKKFSTRLAAVSNIQRDSSPTEVDHYQLRRVIDVFVGLEGEDLGRVANGIDKIIAGMKPPAGSRVELRGMVQGMRSSFNRFGIGLSLSLLLLYLILVAQFKSFLDPLVILLAVPMGLSGVIGTLLVTGTSLNVMSLMGVIMLVGISVSNSILIVDFAHRLRADGLGAVDAVVNSARVRLRPILMTSLATIFGLLPMAMKLGEGSESYAPLARAIVGGLTVSLLFTLFLVPAGYVLAYHAGSHHHPERERQA